MKIAFVSNFINHYQIPLSDELYRLTGGEYYFIEAQEMPDSFRKGGFSDYDRPYIVRAWQNDKEKERSFQLAKDVDIMIAGGGKFILPYERIRLRQGKLTLEYGERPLKRGFINAFSPTNVLTQLHYHFLFYNKPFYKLCVSGYTANDMYFQHCFADRCYKFGYFSEVPQQDVAQVIKARETNKKVRIIWCARMIPWKHPELAVLLAEKLHQAGYDFELNMIGSGTMKEQIAQLIEEKNLSEKVHLLGNFPNNEVLKMMAAHDIFLFTSDRNEGWGVVLNEAMGQVCCPVASNLIGAVPFLLENGKNGMVFQSEDINSLYECVKQLLDHPNQMKELAKEAYRTINTLWTPHIAAERLYKFCDAMLHDKTFVYEEGPLSKAVPTK